MQRQLKTIAIAYTPHLSRAMVVLGAIAALSLFLYGFFLLEAVAHTASRTQAQAQVHNYTSKLSSLEETYLADTRTMTLDKASALGLIAPKEVATVYVNDASHGLSLRTR